MENLFLFFIFGVECFGCIIFISMHSPVAFASQCPFSKRSIFGSLVIFLGHLDEEKTGTFTHLLRNLFIVSSFCSLNSGREISLLFPDNRPQTRLQINRKFGSQTSPILR